VDAVDAVNTGTGPGAITPDGCAVDFYALLPPGPEANIVDQAIPVGAAILELGCGVGRLTGPLIERGHPVVAVDESPEMLAHVGVRASAAETVCARIQDLHLDRQFDVVLLASHLIHADERTRSAFLAACGRHVAPAGRVIIQQHPPDWFQDAAPAESTKAGITARLRDISHPEAGALAATVEYVAGDRVWTQSFTALELSEDRLRDVLAAAGLALDCYLTADHAWLRAVPE
jgi:SAM-dependent methyltransferase